MIDFVRLLIPLSAIFFGILAPVLIVWLYLRFRTERNKLIYETAVRLADKGQSVPPELFANISKPISDLRRGIVLVMFGIGLTIGLYEVGTFWTFGLIPMFMGIGYLIVWQIERSQSRPE
jgi:hypothetical protein